MMDILTLHDKAQAEDLRNRVIEPDPQFVERANEIVGYVDPNTRTTFTYCKDGCSTYACVWSQRVAREFLGRDKVLCRGCDYCARKEV